MKKIFVFLIVMLFVFTSIPSLSGLKINANELVNNKEKNEINEKVKTLSEDVVVHVYVINKKTNLPLSGVDVHMEYDAPPQRWKNHEEKTTNNDGYCKFEGDFSDTSPFWLMTLYNYKRRWEQKYEHISARELKPGSEHTVKFFIERTVSGKTKINDIFQRELFINLLEKLPIILKLI